jgi:hypothetical protein
MSRLHEEMQDHWRKNEETPDQKQERRDVRKEVEPLYGPTINWWEDFDASFARARAIADHVNKILDDRKGR